MCEPVHPSGTPLEAAAQSGALAGKLLTCLISSLSDPMCHACLSVYDSLHTDSCALRQAILEILGGNYFNFASCYYL